MWVIHRNRLRSRLYAHFDNAMSAVFEGRPTPILTPKSAIRELMKQNPFSFNKTIYQDEPDLVYQFGKVHPVLPIAYKQIGYILSLPRIIKPMHTDLYCVTNNAVLINSKFYKYKLPSHLVHHKYYNFQPVYLDKCQDLPDDSKLCRNDSNSIEATDVPCLMNQSLCEVEVRDYFDMGEYKLARTGYLIATHFKCRQISLHRNVSVTVSANEVYFDHLTLRVH